VQCKKSRQQIERQATPSRQEASPSTCDQLASHRQALRHAARDRPCYAERHLGGGVIKILLLIVIGFAVWAVIRAYQRSLDKPSAPARENTVEDMVKCAHCGVNLPRSEAIYSSGDFFCTPEHKQLGKK